MVEDHAVNDAATAPTRTERAGVVALSSFTVASIAADGFLLVSLTWTLTTRGESGVLGALLATLALTRLLLMPVGGVLADRFPRRRLLNLTSAARTVLSIALALTLAGDGHAPAFVVVALLGTVSAVHYPADRAIIVDIVEEGRLGWANSWLETVVQIGQVAGPMVAGLAVAALGGERSLALAAIGYALASVLVLLVRTPRADAVGDHEEAAPESTWQAVTGGARIVLGSTAMLTILVVMSVQNFGFLGPFTIGIPDLVSTTFELGAQWFALLQVAFAAGSLLGALAAGRVRVAEHGVGIVVLTVVTFVGVAGAAVAPHIGWSFALIAVAGIASGLLNVGVTTVLQRITPRRYMGRVMSMVTLTLMGLGPVSQAAAGVTVDRWGGQATLVGAGIASIVVTLLVTPVFVRAIRRLTATQTGS